MKRMMTLVATLSLPLWVSGTAQAEDPFAAGADALAVKASDGSSSLRAKKKLTKMEPDMVQLKVVGIDDSKFPQCVFTGQVLVPAAEKEKHFKLLGAGKIYRFAPVLKMRGKMPNLKDEMTQNNLGACYYPAGTKLVVKVPAVDMKAKVFKAAAIYVK